jgi:hypothetical protein
MAAEKYDEHVKAFFLDLAAKGKDAWNAWRRDPANEDVHVIFASIDFSEALRDQIDFSGFEFGNHADFSRCNWRGAEWNRENPMAFAPGRAFFTGAAFGAQTIFSGATFGNGAIFTGATFGDWAIFSGTTFGGYAIFTGAAFGNADFTGAAFGPLADFAQTHFKGAVAAFIGMPKKKWATDLAMADGMEVEAHVAFEKQHRETWKLEDSGPDRFLTISFANARFDGGAFFSRRSFEMRTNFTSARFYLPPDFDGVANVARIDFTGAQIRFALPGKWHWTTNSNVPVRLRAFRKIAEETKNHDLERDLYIEERKAERGVYLRQRWEELKKEGWKNWPRNLLRLAVHGFWIFIMFLYWALADYGRNVVVPFMWWLVFTFLIFPQLYAALLDRLKHEAGLANAEKYNHVIRMLAFGNAVPFIGPLTIDADLKHFLFCPGFGHCLPIPPEGFQFWVVVQNVVSIILVFFIGLALRNYFKIK